MYEVQTPGPLFAASISIAMEFFASHGGRERGHMRLKRGWHLKGALGSFFLNWGRQEEIYQFIL